MPPHGVEPHGVEVIEIGTSAPDFLLSSDTDPPRRLTDFRGQPVVIAFYPPDWDPARDEQIALYNRLMENLPGAHARLLGIAIEGAWCRLCFRDGEERVPLLSDLDSTGAIARAYGIAGGQALFVLDAEGLVRWRHVSPSGIHPATTELRRALVGLDAGRESAPAGAGAASRPPSRREFVATALAASLALAATAVVSRAEPLVAAVAPPPVPLRAPPVEALDVALEVNGRPLRLALEPRVTLLDALREYAGLTGTKKGCDHGQCGACTVHINGRRVVSCLTFAVMHDGEQITTIEGLAHGDELHPMQAAFVAHDGYQCGYCTPGQIMSATALLHEPCGASDAEVRECMSGNICRCGAYPNIVAAVQEVRGHAPPAGTAG